MPDEIDALISIFGLVKPPPNKIGYGSLFGEVVAQALDDNFAYLAGNQPGGGNIANVKNYGAKGDAVRNPTTGAWTGTDDTVAFQKWEADASAKKLVRYIPEGNYIVKARITRDDGQGFQHDSNVLVYGDGQGLSVIVDQIDHNVSFNALWRYSGVTDEDTSIVSYITANANAGDITLTVNDSSFLAPDMWTLLIDHSQKVIEHLHGSVTCCVGQPARIKDIVDATHVTLYGAVEFDLVADAGDPINGTTIRRFTAPAVNIYFRDLSVVTDPTLTYRVTDMVFQPRRAVGVSFRNITIDMPGYTAQTDEYGLTDCIVWRVQDCRSNRRYDSDFGPSYSVAVGGSFFGVCTGHIMTGGRHLSDGGPTSLNGIEAAHNLFSSCNAYGTDNAVINTHTGARNFTWNDFTATGSGNVGLPGDAAAQPRGRFCTINNLKASAYFVGIYLVEGENTRVYGGELENCGTGVILDRNPGAIVEGVKFLNPRDNAVHINPSPDTTGYWLKDLTVIGNPSGAVVACEGAWDSSWRIDNLLAPDATLLFDGVPADYAWTNLGEVTTGEVSINPQTSAFFEYTNGGAHTLLPPVGFGNSTLDVVNTASPGAITTSLWSKVTGAFTTDTYASFRCNVSAGPAGTLLNINDTTFHQSLITTLTALGLTTGLELCLDLGDTDCYPGTGTAVADLSGNSPAGFSFGGTGLTFAGDADGLSANEYLDFAGTSWLTYAAANTAWMNALHKSGATWTVIALIWAETLGAQQVIMGDEGTDPTHVGAMWGTNQTDGTAIQIANGSGTVGLSAFDDRKAIWAPGVWGFHAMSFDSTVPNSTLMYANGASRAIPSTITSPSAAASTFPLQLGADGAGGHALSAGSRLGQFAIWNSAFSLAQLNSLFSILRQRYGI